MPFLEFEMCSSVIISYIPISEFKEFYNKLLFKGKKKEVRYYPEPLQGRYHASRFFTQESFESGLELYYKYLSRASVIISIDGLSSLAPI